MKKLTTLVFSASIIILLLGCASGPSLEERANEADQQREAERQQAAFRTGLPPVPNPGQGQ